MRRLAPGPPRSKRQRRDPTSGSRCRSLRDAPAQQQHQFRVRAGERACTGRGRQGLTPPSPSAFRVRAGEVRAHGPAAAHASAALGPEVGRGCGRKPPPPRPVLASRAGPPTPPAAAPRLAPLAGPAPHFPPSALLPPRGAPYLAIAAALHAHWPRAGCVGAGPGPAGAGKEGGGGPARGEGGADPDVHSWAPGEVEAPGPAAGGRATDAGTGTAAAAATMVKARRHSLPGPGAPPELASPLSPLPPTLSPGPEQGGSPGWGRGGVPDPGGHHRCRLRRGLPARAAGLGSDPASLSQPPPLAQAGVPLSACRSG